MHPIATLAVPKQLASCLMVAGSLQRSAPLIELVTPELRLPDIVLTRGDQSCVPWSFLGNSPNALEMNRHILAHGRMFNEIDDETARSFCVIGTAIRDELFGSPVEVGHEVIPLGEQVLINQQPFTIIGMFQHYESEAERQQRRLLESEKDHGRSPGPARRGSLRSAEREVFHNKNSTIYVPLTTAWLKLRPVFIPEDILAIRPTSLGLKVRRGRNLDQSLQQARNILMQTHGGIEDFYFFTEEGWDQRIADATRNARLTGGVIAAISLAVGGIVILNITLHFGAARPWGAYWPF